MRKAISIGLIVCVLALGGIGAAFATGMSFTRGVGALSQGTESLPVVTCENVVFNDVGQAGAVNSVKLKFHETLVGGTTILVEVGNDVVGSGATTLGSDVAAGVEVSVTLTDPVTSAEIPGADTVTVTVIGGAFVP